MNDRSHLQFKVGYKSVNGSLGDHGNGRPLQSFARNAKKRCILASLAIVMNLQPSVATSGQPTLASWLPARQAMPAPRGFQDVCARYSWACARGGDAQVNANSLLKLAKSVNSHVNRTTRQITDKRQFGTEDFWTLPTARGGDCEDFALLKKMKLIKQGVPANRLLISTVLDRRRAPHAVLVLRTDAGDFVLDNLNNQVKRWQDTGYTFLRMQNPNTPSRWDAVMAGGVFS
jgi:predicted transglutaminase-like cysteine proteinase